MKNKYDMVRLESGDYAIRKSQGGVYKYMDLQTSNFWWERESLNFKDCIGTFKTVSAVYNLIYAEEMIVNPKTGQPFDEEVTEPPPAPTSKLEDFKVSILNLIESLK